MDSRWSPGEQVGRYRIERLLGRGGMGEVYVAHDAQLGRRVALKTLQGGGDDATLLREARAAAAIDHPNVAQVFDVATVDGVSFLAMELVEGKALRAYVGDASIAFETKVKWLVSIGLALEAAHGGGIVHRDVKPENVMVRSDGVVKVLDFGIARVVPLVDRGAETRTAPGTPEPVVSRVGETHGTTVKGTLAYMAPEQVRGETIDAAADQWAWGVVAYELLSGKSPWRATRDPLAMVAEILSREPEAIAGVGAEVNAVVSRAGRGARMAARQVEAAATLEPPYFGSQMSSNPEGLKAYVSGVEAQNGGASEAAAVALFTRARKLDPNFAAAYLRALLSLEPIEDSYDLLAQAQKRRSQLSAHDRTLLEAIEPWFRSPPDPAELRRRIDSSHGETTPTSVCSAACSF